MKVKLRSALDPFEREPPIVRVIRDLLDKHPNEVFHLSELMKLVPYSRDSVKKILPMLNGYKYVTRRRQIFCGHPKAIREFVKELGKRGLR